MLDGTASPESGAIDLGSTGGEPSSGHGGETSGATGTDGNPTDAEHRDQPDADAKAGDKSPEPKPVTDFDKRVQEKDPSMPEQLSVTGKEIYELLRGPEVARNDHDQRNIGDHVEVKKAIIKKAKEGKLTRDQLLLFLQAAQLDHDEINQIVAEADLPEMQKHTKADAPDAVDPKAKQAVESQAYKQVDEASGKLQELLDDSNSPLKPEDRAAIKEKQNFLLGMKDTVKDLFADGQPGQRFARMAMRIIMWTIIIAVGAVVLDAVAINHAAGKRRN